MRRGIFLITLLNLAGCGHFVRSPQSGYSADRQRPANTDGRRDLDLYKQNLNTVLAEQGMSPEDLRTPEGLNRIQTALEIKTLESQLGGDREKKQYYKSLPWLKDEAEQLEFLRQNGYFARQSWLSKKGIGRRSTDVDKPTEDLIASKDIALGMPNEIVRRSWGSPDVVEVAGNPIYGNERWRYKRYAPSPDGYRLQSRVVYFEAGKVVGWEQIDH